MSRLASLSRVAFAWPFEWLHRRAGAGPADRSASVVAAATTACTGDEKARTETERLERISVYARAGYFHMGYTFDMYPLVGDLPPE